MSPSILQMETRLNLCTGIKFFKLGLRTKVTGWLSDFLVGRVIHVKEDGFLSSKIYPKASAPQGSVLSPFLFLA